MKTTKIKYLIETSAVPVALGESTRAHSAHFAQETTDGTLWTSLYVRKEFIRRWVHYYVHMAFTVDHFSSLDDALFHLNQEFSIRDVKTQNHAIAVLLREKGQVNNCRSMAKELGRLAAGTLKKFDRLFRSRIGNTCGCKIGGKGMVIDHNHFFEDLRRFVNSIDTVHDCPVNEFLGLSKFGRAPRLLEIDNVCKTSSGKQLKKLFEKRKWITCTECARIGDAVIALEQPKTVCLVHIDKDFKVLCTATDRKNKLILSERAVEKQRTADSQ